MRLGSDWIDKQCTLSIVQGRKPGEPDSNLMLLQRNNRKRARRSHDPRKDSCLAAEVSICGLSQLIGYLNTGCFQTDQTSFGASFHSGGTPEREAFIDHSDSRLGFFG